MGESQDMARFRSPSADSGSQLSQSQRDWAYVVLSHAASARRRSCETLPSSEHKTSTTRRTTLAGQN